MYHTTDTTTVAYNEGANLVSGMFGWYNLFAAAFGLVLLPFLAKLTNRKITHSIALIVGGVGLASILILNNPQHMIFSMIGIGLAWASILAMPYAILTGSLPSHKMGVYMGIFNFFIWKEVKWDLYLPLFKTFFAPGAVKAECYCRVTIDQRHLELVKS